jgi:2-oxoglutarate ferredoxin oxidoreductase subunit beta
MHKGMAFIDVISPCVTFNDHEGSTKSYAYTREHNVQVVVADFVAPAHAIETDYESGALQHVTLHDGSQVRLRKLADDYDPTDRDKAYAAIRARQEAGEVLTGLLYVSSESTDMHAQMGTIQTPLVDVPFESLCPGNAQLQQLQARFR